MNNKTAGYGSPHLHEFEAILVYIARSRSGKTTYWDSISIFWKKKKSEEKYTILRSRNTTIIIYEKCSSPSNFCLFLLIVAHTNHNIKFSKVKISLPFKWEQDHIQHRCTYILHERGHKSVERSQVWIRLDGILRHAPFGAYPREACFNRVPLGAHWL